ncbi:hypothetical protein A8709_20985 [Paenibacillus pectinilyticus]|uniref:HAMP domain-containing protein n=1 Tax=Paenibacillus pectinilyticus TaxID=512399 RepID=A0A1C0ZXJ3_9BACL|nr:sensor histidine kinase [Paenibacillus pectinilyticus]OCT12817.1 hypothetical protein A8709_20985 [Paenibacillus pectinilyticus]
MLRRLLLTYVILIVLPLTVASAFAYIVFKKNMEYQVSQSVQRTVELLHRETQSYFDDMVNLTTSVMNDDKITGGDESVFSILRKREKGNGDQLEDYVQRQKIDLYLNNNFLNRYRQLNEADLLLQTGERFSAKRTATIASMEQLQRLQQQLLASGKEWIVASGAALNANAGNGDRSVYILRRINEPLTLRYIGCVVLNLNVEELNRSLYNALLPEQDVVLLWDRGLVVLDTSNQWEQEPIVFKDTDRKSVNKMTPHGEVLVSFSSPEDSEWSIVTYLPYSALSRGMDKVRDWIIGISLACISLSMIVAFAWVKGIVKPLQSLRNALKRMEKGLINTKVIVQGKDEVADLAIVFNGMTDKLSESIDQMYRVEIAHKEAELRALQAQIDPHFLYNALESIRMMAVMQGASDAGEMARALGVLFRAATDFHTEIPLQQELLLLRQYVLIQEMRFDGHLFVDYHISPDAEDIYVPKLLLQPLVENCFKHAFPQALMETQNCRIDITVSVKGNQAHIVVADNGIGMDDHHIQMLQTKLRSSYTQSVQVGIMNVNDRIRLKWGEDYGLDLLSGQDAGMTVTLKLPIKLGKEEAM